MPTVAPKLRPPPLKNRRKFVKVDRIPIIDIHTRKYKRENELGRMEVIEEEVDPSQLSRICRNSRDMADRGEYGLVFLGHTDDDGPETAQPPVVGFLANHDVGEYNGRPTILADMYLYKEDNPSQITKQYPRRSAEVIGINDENGYIDSVALIKRAPERRLGLVTSQYRAKRRVYRYACPSCEKEEIEMGHATLHDPKVVKHALALVTELVTSIIDHNAEPSMDEPSGMMDEDISDGMGEGSPSEHFDEPSMDEGEEEDFEPEMGDEFEPGDEGEEDFEPSEPSAVEMESSEPSDNRGFREPSRMSVTSRRHRRHRDRLDPSGARYSRYHHDSSDASDASEPSDVSRYRRHDPSHAANRMMDASEPSEPSGVSEPSEPSYTKPMHKRTSPTRAPKEPPAAPKASRSGRLDPGKHLHGVSRRSQGAAGMPSASTGVPTHTKTREPRDKHGYKDLPVGNSKIVRHSSRDRVTRMRDDEERTRVSRYERRLEEMQGTIDALVDERNAARKQGRLDKIEREVIQLESEGILLDRVNTVTRLSKVKDKYLDEAIEDIRQNYRRVPTSQGMIPARFAADLGGNSPSKARDVSARPADESDRDVYGASIARFAESLNNDLKGMRPIDRAMAAVSRFRTRGNG